MTPKHYVRLAIVGGILIIGMLIFLPRDQVAGVAACVAAAIGTVLFGQLPGPKAYILQHRRAAAVAGWTMAGLGLILSLVMGWNRDRVWMSPGLGVSVVGIALASLSRSLKDAENLKARLESPRLEGWSGLHEGLDALALPIREFPMSVRVLGPWLALFVAAPAVLLTPLVLIGADRIKHIGKDNAMLALLAIFAAILIMYLALMAAAIQWARFVNDGRPPPLRVPWRPLWSFAWRWWVFGGIWRVADALGPWLKTHYPALPTWASVSLTSLASLTILTLFSFWGLVLPALALEAKDYSITSAAAVLRIIGRRFYLGALVVLAPFALVSWVVELLPETYPKAWGAAAGAVPIAVLAIWALSFILTIPAAMTYLTRARMVAA